MDDIKEDSIPENCMILSPEELTKLGVKVEGCQLLSSTSTNSGKKLAKSSEAKKKKGEQSMDVGTTNVVNEQNQTNFASCNKTIKVLNSCQEGSSQISSNERNFLDKLKDATKHQNIHDNSNITELNINKKCDDDNIECTENYANNSSASCGSGKVTISHFADECKPPLDSINLSSSVQKRKRGRPKKLLSPVANEYNVSAENLLVTSKLFVDNVINRGLKNESCTDDSLVDSLNEKSKNILYTSGLELDIKTSNTEVKKRRRGRPKKSLPTLLNQNDSMDIGPANELPDSVSDYSYDLPPNKPKTICDKSFDIIPGQLEKRKSRKAEKGITKKYKVLNGDLSPSMERNYDSDSDVPLRTKPKKRKKVRRIIDSDSSFESDYNSKTIKMEAGSTRSKVACQNSENIDLGIGNKNRICEENKTLRKRGRPKKSASEAILTTFPNTSISHNEIVESLITTKRGRKTKEVNYLLMENPDLFDDSKSSKVSLKNNIKKEADYNLHHEIDDDGIEYSLEETETPSETPEINNDSPDNELHGSSNEINKDESTSSVQATTRYKWTGNVTKAINQMFNAIKDNSISDSKHDPLLGKKKKKGKNASADLLDTKGSSTCMICNETVPNPEWSKHKTKVHYNLAWRKGDGCLDVTNQEFVFKTFKQLIKDEGYIKCNKCTAKIKNPKKFVTHLEICNGVINSNGLLTCAVCNTEMERESWQYHNYRQHNNLAWRTGDPPLNLEDQDFVLRILNGLYKAKKPLYCEKCGSQKKSVLGYLSHKTTCQKSKEELENMKVACELCHKKVLPVSMDYHMKIHEEKESKFNYSRNSDYFDVNVDITGKRRAATQALQIIKSLKVHTTDETKYYVSQCDFQESFVSDVLRKKLREHSSVKCIFLNCDYSADVVESIAHHMNSCEQKPDQYFVCKLCLSWYKEESEIHEHIKAEHNRLVRGNQDVEFKSGGEEDDSEDDQILDEIDREKKRLRLVGKQRINQSNLKLTKPIFLVHPIRESTSSLLYHQAYVWMLEFCETNYNKFNLYQYLRNDRPWQVLDSDILANYLPKSLQSCDIAAELITAKENHDNFDKLSYKNLDLFEVSHLHEDDITIYCGGPISALAWLPTPYNQETYEQVLAVAVFNSMEDYYVVGKNYYEPYVIQFWNFGILNCHQKNGSKPSLLFGMALSCGPVWHLEWCPSGCFDCFEEDTTFRLGLLAVAASDSFVYIYSIDNIPIVNDRGFIYKGEPVLKLQLESDKSSLEGQYYYPTRISWSKAKSHRYVAVGYSTGLIALYDLHNESLLLQRGEVTGTNLIFPYHSFQAHYSSITALTLSHLSGGNRFLFSASFDRTSLFWDLSTTTKITSCKKNTIADGVWMTQWPSHLVVEDESTFNDRAQAHSYYKALRNLMSPEPKNFTMAVSGIKTMSYSDWLNAILHGSNSGEVMAQFTHRMFFSIDGKMFKTRYKRCMFSVTKLVKKSESVSNIAKTYDEAEKKYKVVFVDYNLNNVDNTPSSTPENQLKPEKLSKYDITEYSLQSINKIAFNPNQQAYSFYAVGYQAGFVRLQWIRFVNQSRHKY